jgi:hypothetical protein
MIPTYANGKWLAASQSSDPSYQGVYSSEDGVTWTQQSVFSGMGNDLAYGNDIWVCATRAGLWYSEDGATWLQSNVTSTSFATVVFANGMWIANPSTGAGAYLQYSADGKTWTATTVGWAGCNALYHDGSKWVAAQTNVWWTSKDGVSWTQVSSLPFGTNSIKQVDGLWVLASSFSSDGGVYYSEDGATWIKGNLNEQMYDVQYANGIWVARGHTAFYYSKDGKTWVQSVLIEHTTQHLQYADGMCVATTSGGVYYSEQP